MIRKVQLKEHIFHGGSHAATPQVEAGFSFEIATSGIPGVVIKCPTKKNGSREVVLVPASAISAIYMDEEQPKEPQKK